jgi:CelD/BcsL family acetyltransferase involved in cellulose biosynthesis
MSMTVATRIEQVDQLPQLEATWKQLQASCPGITVFSTWEWCEPAARHFAASNRLAVIVLEDAGEPVALAPLAFRRCGILRAMVLLGTGLRNFSHADYQDFLLASGRQEEALALLVDEWAADSAWDLVWLQELPASSPLLELLPVLARRRGWHVTVTPTTQTFVIALPGSWETYAQRLSRKRRAALRRAERRLMQGAGARFVSAAADEDPGQDLNQLIDLHSMRMKTLGAGGIFEEETVRAFHLDIARAMQQAGMLDLGLLKLDGDAIGGRYCFVFRGTKYCYADGFNPNSPWARIGLGLVMDTIGIQQSIEAGLSHEDLLRGGGRYKHRYSPETRQNFQLHIFRNRRAQLVYTLQENCRALLRGVRARLLLVRKLKK